METRSLSKLTKYEKDLKILKLMNELNVKVIVSCILQNYTLRYREILIRKLFCQKIQVKDTIAQIKNCKAKNQG